ncbi:hypothetical protein V8F33_010347 [Rhypophila sp. PSN 637]
MKTPYNRGLLVALGWLHIAAMASLAGAANPPLPMMTPPPVLGPREQPGDGEYYVKALPKEFLKASLREGHTKYLTEEQSTTKWIGPDPSWIAVHTSTIKQEGKPDEVKTATQGVQATKNQDGGLDILFSPKVKSKLEAIAHEVKPCAAKKKRRGVGAGGPNTKRAEACGVREFLERVGEDPELSETFGEQVTDQMWGEIDEGYQGEPGEVPGYEGDGFAEGTGDLADEGYFSDAEGWFEGAAEGEGEGTVETIVIGTAEEAAAVAEAAVGGNEAVAAAGTVAATSLLAALFGAVVGGGSLPEVVSIPKENIHKISKPKEDKEGDKKKEEEEKKGCRDDRGYMFRCDPACKPTAQKNNDKVESWKCTEGERKDCSCNPGVVEFTNVFDWELQKTLMASFDAASDKMPDFKDPPLEAHCDSDRTALPSKYFEAVANAFCDDHFSRDVESGIGLIQDIYGKQITDGAKRRVKRSPPERPMEAFADDWTFHLTWKPKQDGECFGVDENNLCKDAFYKLRTSQCGINHGSPVDRLYSKATLDIGCGEIGWEAGEKMAPPPKIGDQKCYKPYKHKDIKKKDQWNFVLDICRSKLDGQVVDKNYGGVRWSNPPGFSGSFMHVEISWVDGCEDFQDQKLDFPAEPDPYACPNILHDNYLQCDNGGGGGWKQIGCLKYEFHAGADVKENQDLQ